MFVEDYCKVELLEDTRIWCAWHNEALHFKSGTTFKLGNKNGRTVYIVRFLNTNQTARTIKEEKYLELAPFKYRLI